MENSPEWLEDGQIDWRNLVDNYTFAACVRNAAGDYNHADYYLVGSLNGVDYYTPNDEDWGCIIAVDHRNQLAAATSFYDMGDIYPGSDYEFVAHEGKLLCRFEAENNSESLTRAGGK